MMLYMHTPFYLDSQLLIPVLYIYVFTHALIQATQVESNSIYLLTATLVPAHERVVNDPAALVVLPVAILVVVDEIDLMRMLVVVIGEFATHSALRYVRPLCLDDAR